MTPAGLAVDEALAAELLDLARRELPTEACAILSGADPHAATRVHPARNALASPYRYDVDPDDLIRILDRIEAAGEVMVAIFHSHPAGEAVPSAADLRESRWDVVQLIASPGDTRAGWLRAWRIEEGEAREVELRLTSRGGGRPPSALA